MLICIFCKCDFLNIVRWKVGMYWLITKLIVFLGKDVLYLRINLNTLLSRAQVLLSAKVVGILNELLSTHLFIKLQTMHPNLFERLFESQGLHKVNRCLFNSLYLHHSFAINPFDRWLLFQFHVGFLFDCTYWRAGREDC